MPNHIEPIPELTRRSIFLMALCCALAVSSIYYNLPLLPQIASSFGVTPTRGNPIAAVTQTGYATGRLLFVPLDDGVQPRKLASRAIACNAAALAACAAAPTLPAFCVGVSAITAQIIIPAASGRSTPANRGRIVDILLGGLSSGVLLARTMFVLASTVDLMLLSVISKLPASTGLATIRYRHLMRSLIVLVREESLLRISIVIGLLTFAVFSAFWATLAALVDRVGARMVASVGALSVLVAYAIVASGACNLFWLIGLRVHESGYSFRRQSGRGPSYSAADLAGFFSPSPTLPA
jgi:predicted MFS family arabinose efflux permease